jgi:hypothetical protein
VREPATVLGSLWPTAWRDLIRYRLHTGHLGSDTERLVGPNA